TFVEAADVDNDGQADLITVNDQGGGFRSGNPARGATNDENVDVLLNNLDMLCPGDANGDDTVNFADLEILLEGWGTTVTPGTEGDVNYSGFVDFADLEILLDAWGSACGST
ncbi:MAG: hypothetical protein KDA21_03795, partial [Phycisphaerales bacterium]|nr:hypothetical protein [Phycisphaerales bacterium]